MVMLISLLHFQKKTKKLNKVWVKFKNVSFTILSAIHHYFSARSIITILIYHVVGWHKKSSFSSRLLALTSRYENCDPKDPNWCPQYDDDKVMDMWRSAKPTTDDAVANGDDTSRIGSTPRSSRSRTKKEDKTINKVRRTNIAWNVWSMTISMGIQCHICTLPSSFSSFRFLIWMGLTSSSQMEVRHSPRAL